jgi:hypothetical protein
MKLTEPIASDFGTELNNVCVCSSVFVYINSNRKPEAERSAQIRMTSNYSVNSEVIQLGSIRQDVQRAILLTHILS